jgi:2-oxoglutarate dehydrogenase E2 component (dihydrolipoamide succinyltransferase)
MIHDLIMPHMGESITEATILRWLVKEGDVVTKDQAVLEIATDKVDSEISAPVAGVLTKILFYENAVVPVDAIIATIADTESEPYATFNLNTESDTTNVNNSEDLALSDLELKAIHDVPFVPNESFRDQATSIEVEGISFTPKISTKSDRFYSPLVKTISKE